MKVPAHVRLASLLVPAPQRAAWLEEWAGELAAAPRGGAGLGAFADAWYLRRESWAAGLLSSELRLAVRTLLRQPSFTVLAVGTLALGIGAAATIYAVVDNVLVDALPYPEADRLVAAHHVGPGLGPGAVPQSEGTYRLYSEQVTSFESLAVYLDGDVTVLVADEPLRISAAWVSATFLEVLRVQPALGRGLRPDEDTPGTEPMVLVSHGLWERAFGSSPAAVGSMLDVDGVARRVIGVLPEGFSLPEDTDLWIPLEIDRADPQMGALTFAGIARLADGATAAGAQREMRDVVYRMVDENPFALAPREALEDRGFDAQVVPLKSFFVEDVESLLWLVLGAVAFVLLMTCANVANLFLLRADAARSEQAVRLALGGGRGRVARRWLVEATVVAVAAGGVALGVAALAVPALVAAVPVDIPRVGEIGIDGSVLGAIVLACLAVGVLIACPPMLLSPRATRSAQALREGGRSATGRSTGRLRSALAAVQVAMALVLLAGSGLMARTFLALRDVDPGFQSAGRVTFRVALSQVDYPEVEDVRDFYSRLEQGLMAVPGVERVSMDTGLPLRRYMDRMSIDDPDRPTAADEIVEIVERRSVAPGYFATMGIPLQGRDFEWASGGEGNVIVNEALARRLWPGESAIGKRIRAGRGGPEWTVVGVAGDVHLESIQAEPSPLVYVEMGLPNRDMRAVDVVVKAGLGTDPTALVPQLRETLRGLDPRLPFISPRSLDDTVRASLSATSFVLVLLAVAGSVALLLGTVGIYGTISYLVAQSRREIGLRMALGAPDGHILGGLVRRGLLVAAGGLVIGLACAWALGRTLGSFLYGVEPMDAPTLAATCALLVAVTALASWIPSRSALDTEPMLVLRSE